MPEIRYLAILGCVSLSFGVVMVNQIVPIQVMKRTATVLSATSINSTVTMDSVFLNHGFVMEHMTVSTCQTKQSVVSFVDIHSILCDMIFVGKEIGRVREMEPRSRCWRTPNILPEN